MPQQLSISNGRVTVLEVGPRGIRGPRGEPGERGLTGPVNLRTGVELIVPTEEIVEEVTYLVYTMGSSNAAIYISMCPVGEVPVIMRVDSDSANAQPFKFTLVAVTGGLDVFNNEFFMELPTFGLKNVPMWQAYDNHSINVQMSVLPGGFFLLDEDLWYPVNMPLSPARSGASFIEATPLAGDGVTAPDCLGKLQLEAVNAATVTVDVDTYSYPRLELVMSASLAQMAKPFRLELLNAAAVTDLEIYEVENEGTTYTFNTAYLASLVVGTSIICTVQVVNRGAGNIIVLDPIH